MVPAAQKKLSFGSAFADRHQPSGETFITLPCRIIAKQNQSKQDPQRNRFLTVWFLTARESIHLFAFIRNTSCRCFFLQIDSIIIYHWSILKQYLANLTQTTSIRKPFSLCSQKHITSPHRLPMPASPGALDVWDPPLAIHVHLPELQHLCHGDHAQTQQVARHVEALLGQIGKWRDFSWGKWSI